MTDPKVCPTHKTKIKPGQECGMCWRTGKPRTSRQPAPLDPRVRRLVEAARAVRTWWERDGSTGGAEDVLPELCFAVDALRAFDAPPAVPATGGVLDPEVLAERVRAVEVGRGD